VKKPDRPPARRGIPLRTIVPNAVTALALCSGLFGIRYGIEGHWRLAATAIAIAAVLDGLDGRIARLLNGQSRFGAELDSLSDVTACGVAPALIIYQWVREPLLPDTAALAFWGKWGWVFALAHAACCALRLARFNANIDVEVQPHKSAGFLTGVPAPAGAGLLFLPVYLYLATDLPLFREPWLVAPWTALVAFLLISNLATFSWASIRLRRQVRLPALLAIMLVGAALLSDPWPTLSIAAILYLLLIPFSIYSYGKVRRRAAGEGRKEAGDTDAPRP
jgi:CDP-diacylglycerol--serine O-phosphatidyltransferase